jgi:hypothetical protein
MTFDFYGAPYQSAMVIASLAMDKTTRHAIPLLLRKQTARSFIIFDPDQTIRKHTIGRLAHVSRYLYFNPFKANYQKAHAFNPVLAMVKEEDAMAMAKRIAIGWSDSAIESFASFLSLHVLHKRQARSFADLQNIAQSQGMLDIAQLLLPFAQNIYLNRSDFSFKDLFAKDCPSALYLDMDTHSPLELSVILGMFFDLLASHLDERLETLEHGLILLDDVQRAFNPLLLLLSALPSFSNKLGVETHALAQETSFGHLEPIARRHALRIFFESPSMMPETMTFIEKDMAMRARGTQGSHHTVIVPLTLMAEYGFNADERFVYMRHLSRRFADDGLPLDKKSLHRMVRYIEKITEKEHMPVSIAFKQYGFNLLVPASG